MLCSVREKKGSVLFFNLEKKTSKLLYFGGGINVQNTPFLWGWEYGYWNLHFYLLAYVKEKRTHTKWFLSHIAGGSSVIQRTLKNNLSSSRNGEDVQISNSAIPVYGLHPGETRTPRPGDMRTNTVQDSMTCVRTCTVQESEGIQTNRWVKQAGWKIHAGWSHLHRNFKHEK